MGEVSLEKVLMDEEFIDSHPHLGKVKRDRIVLIKYSLYALTKSHQISKASVFYNSECVDLPGDWIASIARDAIIITSQGFPVESRKPLIVKAWKRKKDSSGRNRNQAPFGTYIDQDNFEWEFEKEDPKLAFYGSCDRLIAFNEDGSNSMTFEMPMRTDITAF